MCTMNYRTLAFNGDMGTVVNFVNLECSQVCIYDQEPTASSPGVVVLLDRTGQSVCFRAAKQEIEGAGGDVLYRIRNIPLVVAAATTVHKVIGLSMKNIVVDLAYEDTNPGRANTRIHRAARRSLQSEWLHGLLYTAMSRTGTSNGIFLKYVGMKTFCEKITFSPSAVKFERYCLDHNRLSLNTSNSMDHLRAVRSYSSRPLDGDRLAGTNVSSEQATQHGTTEQSEDTRSAEESYAGFTTPQNGPAHSTSTPPSTGNLDAANINTLRSYRFVPRDQFLPLLRSELELQSSALLESVTRRFMNIIVNSSSAGLLDSSVRSPH